MTDSFESKLDLLKKRFCERTLADAGDLDAMTSRLENACGQRDDPGHDLTRGSIGAISHRLAGTAGTFGYSQLTQCAAYTEEIAGSAAGNCDVAEAGRTLARRIRQIMAT